MPRSLAEGRQGVGDSLRQGRRYTGVGLVRVFVVVVVVKKLY